MQKGVEMPQQIEPGWQKKIQGACTKTAQASKYDFRRDRCVFRKSASRLHGKLIFEVSAIHLDGNTSPGAISGSVLVFSRCKKHNTVLEIAPGGVLPPRLKLAGPKIGFPCKRHVDFEKAHEVGL